MYYQDNVLRFICLFTGRLQTGDLGSLVISPVQINDHGIYWCIVKMLNRPAAPNIGRKIKLDVQSKYKLCQYATILRPFFNCILILSFLIIQLFSVKFLSSVHTHELLLFPLFHKFPLFQSLPRFSTLLRPLYTKKLVIH